MCIYTYIFKKKNTPAKVTAFITIMKYLVFNNYAFCFWNAADCIRAVACCLHTYVYMYEYIWIGV